jgi:hypothetical protein
VGHGVAVVVEALPRRVGERRGLALDLLHRGRQGLLLRGRQGVRGRDEPADAGTHLVEDVAPAAPALAAERGGLLLVHLEVAREFGLLGQEPADPLPPPLQVPGGERAGERRRRFGPPERPLGRRGRDGLDLAGKGGQPLPQAHEVALLVPGAALEGRQLVLERPRRQEPCLLDVLQDGGHGWCPSQVTSKQKVGYRRGPRGSGEMAVSSSSLLQISSLGVDREEDEEEEGGRYARFAFRTAASAWTGWFYSCMRGTRKCADENSQP